MTMTDVAPRAAALPLTALPLAGCGGGSGAPDPLPLAASIDGPGPADPAWRDLARVGLSLSAPGVRINDFLVANGLSDLAALLSVAAGLGAPEPLLVAYATAAP